MLDVKLLKKDFPILDRLINGKPLVYLDNAATSQKPLSVINAEVAYYSLHNSNVHRGLHTLSEEATELYDNARKTVAEFINASSEKEIIFTKGATESLNRVAFEWGVENLQKDDVILSTDFEHHSNLIPWQIVAKRTGAKLVFIHATEEGLLDIAQVRSLFESHNGKIKLVTLTHASNVLGTITPVKEISKLAHEHGALVCVDGAQAIPHLKVNVQSLGCDFYCFSGHKMLGPMGIGVMWAKRELLEKLAPYEYGGGMIDDVTYDSATFAQLPERFEAGTPNVGGALGLSAAIDYLKKLGMDNIREHEIKLNDYAINKLSAISDLTILGPKNPALRTGLIAFTVTGIHSHDMSSVLNDGGVAVRSGHHCVMPYHISKGIPASTRASWYLYNDFSDIDALILGIEKAKQILL